MQYYTYFSVRKNRVARRVSHRSLHQRTVNRQDIAIGHSVFVAAVIIIYLFYTYAYHVLARVGLRYYNIIYINMCGYE